MELGRRGDEHPTIPSAIAATIDDLPDELLQHILSFMTCARRAVGPIAVCTRWRRAVLDPSSPWSGQCTVFYMRRRARRCETAALHGHLACLVEMRQKGCAWNAKVCANAARGGHIECLVYAHENACPWDERTPAQAAAGGHMACLAYAHEHGCPWDRFTTANAAAAGHLQCLRYAADRDCPLGPHVARKATVGGHPDSLALVYESGCRWTPDFFFKAIAHERLACLAYLFESCPMRVPLHLCSTPSCCLATVRERVAPLLKASRSPCASFARERLSQLPPLTRFYETNGLQ
ncbi:F-box domain containing protein [Pandoravirus salinus]|uniref:F-box domain containing protein n=1 Tax=Pandoravirus salinus TaxID=1349410 RepID=S4W1V9_9VIRU|nr:F-box domain [Pandoravirus salinus]AGO84422.1 F-box domain containing protein [Pandoravirus salinus]